MDFCSVCGENDSISNCKTCNFCCCEICLIEDVCKSCIGDLCPLCNKNKLDGNFNDQKYCENCDRICCLDCISSTDCQTTYGTCKECFK